MDSNNKRIAKNTMMLYVRMLFIMVVTLYTSRIILNILGVEDYGIYTVIGGIVALFSVFSSSLSAAISRFITYELGKGDEGDLKKIFSTAVIIQIALAIFICLLMEIGGVWFLNNRMNIPVERIGAANWVLQSSIFTFMVNLVSVPYNAAIIAHERMKAFAFISILDVILKLLAVFTLYFGEVDKLIIYALQLSVIALITRLVYGFYCNKKFKECRFVFIYDRKIFKQMVQFAGWNIIGASSGILRDQGVNVLLNIFGSPVINAARGIAMQVYAAASSFAGSFITALNPQITKSFASNDRAYSMKLVFQGARFSFYLMLILSLPILMETHSVLSLWLGVIPEYSVTFVRLMLICVMTESISFTMVTLMLATGKIRNYQIIVGGCQMLNFPLSYIALKLGYPPEVTLIIAIVIAFCCLLLRLYMLHNMVGLSVISFFRNVFLNIFSVGVASFLLPFFLLQIMEDSWGRFWIICFICLLSTLCSIFFVGCSQNERIFILEKVQKFKFKIFFNENK